jgi:hypothetical protein
MNRNVLVLAVAVQPFMVAPVWTEKPAPPAAAHSSTVDDFEDGDRQARSGRSWISIADDLTGGESLAELSLTAPGAGSQRALRVAGTLAAGGFAGAWVALDGRAQPTDVTDFEGVRLRIRGAGTFQLALRAGAMPGHNYLAPIEAGAEWKQVSVPFADLRAANPGGPAIDLGAVRWMGVTRGSGQPGRFEFQIDDVELYASRADARLRVQSASTMAVGFEPSPSSAVPRGACRELAQDPPDDGKQKRLPDATALAVCRDDAHDRVWFRIALAGPLPKRWLGANVALDVDGDPANGMAWWGTNTSFHFDRLVTVYGSEAGPGYEGMIGIADAAEVRSGSMNGSRGERVLVVLDSAKPAFVIGIPQSALGADARTPVRLVAAVGSAFQHNDDVPNEGVASLGR